jgi:predicted nucleotidyltransferase
VHMGIRQGSTEDIDVEVRSANEDEMLEAIRRLKDTLSINIELASPADFMPVPEQWEMNAIYVGRYGSIDVFYFDFYSIALSKIERGNTRDINDVKLLIRQGVITLAELDAVFNKILPRVGKPPYKKLDPKEFATRYNRVRQLL